MQQSGNTGWDNEIVNLFRIFGKVFIMYKKSAVFGSVVVSLDLLEPYLIFPACNLPQGTYTVRPCKGGGSWNPKSQFKKG